jgi:hypothetical protein
MGHRHTHSNPQKRGIYGLESPQQDRQGKLQIQEAGSHPGKPADFPCVDKKDANTYNIAAQCFLPDLLEQVIASSFLYQCSNRPFW